MTDRYGVIVVGGGASGVLSAAHLANRPGRPIAIVGSGTTWGRGVAYSTTDDGHLLNTPAEVMSAYHDDPAHFSSWLAADSQAQALPHDPANTFAPRTTYARYLDSVIDGMTGTASVREVQPVSARALGVRVAADSGVHVTLDDGRVLTADHVVLALGHGAPADLPVMTPVLGSPGYVSDPWSPGALDSVSDNRPILLIGSGLTAVDVVITLLRRGHTGPVTMLSRHGLLPTAHSDPRQSAHTVELDTRTAATAIRSLRGVIRKLADSPQPDGTLLRWQAVFDGLRPSTDQFWSRLSLIEQRRFLRHLFRYWEIHRHRMAPPIARLIDEARQAGQLTVVGASVRGARGTSGGIELEFAKHGRGREAAVRPDYGHVINCTGPTSALRSPQPLLADALRAGLVRVDPLGLGLDTDERGIPRSSDGATTEWLSLVGPLRRNHRCWESTAVPELRAQAASMARVH